MALYTFVGIFCSFIAVDVTKSLISKKASGFLNFLNRFAVASLSIILANLLGLAWLMAYSEFFVKAWFPEMYQFGQMLIAFLGASIWMSIFFVPLFHYLHVKNKVQYKKWIYSAFLIVIIALPLSFAFQNGKSAEDNLPSDSDNLLTFNAICFTGIKNMYLLVFISESSISTYPLVDKYNSEERDVHIESGTSLYEKVKVSVDKDNNLTFASGQNTSENQNFELVKKGETIFYESSNEFIKLNGKCVLYNDGGVSDAIAVAKFLKSQDRAN